MNCVSFPAQSLSLADHSAYVSPVVWAEAVHVLVRTYIAGALRKLMAGEAEQFVRAVSRVRSSPWYPQARHRKRPRRPRRRSQNRDGVWNP